MGDRKREIQLLLNADRLNAYGISSTRCATPSLDRTSKYRADRSPSDRGSRAPHDGRIRNVQDFNRIVLA
jgi:hypothetical protein